MLDIIDLRRKHIPPTQGHRGYIPQGLAGWSDPTVTKPSWTTGNLKILRILYSGMQEIARDFGSIYPKFAERGFNQGSNTTLVRDSYTTSLAARRPPTTTPLTPLPREAPSQ